MLQEGDRVRINPPLVCPLCHATDPDESLACAQLRLKKSKVGQFAAEELEFKLVSLCDLQGSPNGRDGILKALDCLSNEPTPTLYADAEVFEAVEFSQTST
jgi:hypothetical protein